jgi:hypothetical protein
MDRLPAGIVPFGDAICGFNPIYGQGMSVAALEAAALDRCLERDTRGLAGRFLAATLPLVEGAWKLATGGDSRFLAPAHAFPPDVQAMHRYLDRLHLAARSDAAVARAFSRVMHLLEPPSSLMSADIMDRVAGAQAPASSAVRTGSRAPGVTRPAPASLASPAGQAGS